MTKNGSSPSTPNVLLAAMPHTKGQPSLPFADIEVRRVSEVVSEYGCSKIIEKPSKNEFMDKSSGTNILHFACHGQTAYPEVDRSVLLLQDWEENALTVSDLLALDIRQASLVYLSACHSALYTSEEPLDDPMHISGVFQLAGIPSVVGTLWNVSDSYSANLATRFYRILLEGGKLDIKRSALSLHQAVRELRSVTSEAELSSKSCGEDDPLYWGSYIHVGA